MRELIYGTWMLCLYLIPAATTMPLVWGSLDFGSGLVIAPESPVPFCLDFAGSLVVTLYLIRCGLRTMAVAVE